MQEQLERVSRRSGTLVQAEQEAAQQAAQEAAQSLATVTAQRDTLADQLSKAAGEQLDSAVELQALLAEQSWLLDELAMSEVQTEAAKASLQSANTRCSSLQQQVTSNAWTRVCEEVTHRSTTTKWHRQIDSLQADSKDLSSRLGDTQSAKAFLERQGQEEVAEHGRTKSKLQQAEAKQAEVMSQLTDSCRQEGAAARGHVARAF